MTDLQNPIPSRNSMWLSWCIQLMQWRRQCRGDQWASGSCGWPKPNYYIAKVVDANSLDWFVVVVRWLPEMNFNYPSHPWSSRREKTLPKVPASSLATHSTPKSREWNLGVFTNERRRAGSCEIAKTQLIRSRRASGPKNSAEAEEPMHVGSGQKPHLVGSSALPTFKKTRNNLPLEAKSSLDK